MARTTIKLNEQSDYPTFLEELGLPHTATFTNSTIKLQTDDTTYLISPRHFKMSELGFIQQVKRHMEEISNPDNLFAMPLQPYGRADVGYFKFNSVPPGIYRDVVEIDVNAAYWHLANRLGYLSPDIYEKGLNTKKLSKVARLVALGAVAATKRIYTFDGEEYSENIQVIENPITRSYFFHIAKTLDDIMSEVFDGLPAGDGLLYWCDAFFIRKRSARQIIDGLANHGLECKSLEVANITVRETPKGTKITSLMIEVRTPKMTKVKIKPFYKASTRQREGLIKDAMQRRAEITGANS